MPGPADIRPLEHIAIRRYGLFTLAEADRLGITRTCLRRRRNSGAIIQVLPGVFRFHLHPPSFEQKAIASLLWAGSEAALSHSTAGHLWKLEGVEAARSIHVTMPAHRRSSVDWLVIHTQPLPASSLKRTNELRVTSVPITLLGMAAERHPFIEKAFDSALHHKLTDVRSLTNLVDSCRPGTPGLALIRKLASRYDSGPALESMLEKKLLQLVRAYGLPEPTRQLKVTGADGRQMRLDFAYPELRLAIECDGFNYHGGRGHWARDLDRNNSLTLEGWRVIHVTWERVAGKPEAVAAEVRAAIAVAIRAGDFRRMRAP